MGNMLVRNMKGYKFPFHERTICLTLGGIEELGSRITFKITDPTDLSRDVLTVNV